MSIHIEGLNMPYDGTCINIRIWWFGGVEDLGRFYSNFIEGAKATSGEDFNSVKRGKWEVSKTEFAWNTAEYPTHVKCSRCGREIMYQDRDNFCPSCGADMREDIQ